MIRFNNDYNHGAHPEILEVLRAVNDNSFGGYGEDEWCKKAADLIRERVHCPDAAIHFGSLPEHYLKELLRRLGNPINCARYCHSIYLRIP